MNLQLQDQTPTGREAIRLPTTGEQASEMPPRLARRHLRARLVALLHTEKQKHREGNEERRDMFEWNLFEEAGALFLLREGAPLVFEVDLENSRGWTWPELKAFLERCLDGQCPELQKPLPIKPKLYPVRELLGRLSSSTTLVTWIDGASEVGYVKRDHLPEAADTFLQQVDAPTSQALAERRRLKEQGLGFDGAWMPSTISQVLALLSHFGAYPSGSGRAPWRFQERVTAKDGKLISLYEITRAGWGFALRGLDQQEVIREFEAFLAFLQESRPLSPEGDELVPTKFRT